MSASPSMAMAAPYGASKGGVITLSKVMAVDLAQFGIRVNVIAPGPVETPLVAQVHSPETREEWGRRVPLKRYGSPDEMAGAAVFLLSVWSRANSNCEVTEEARLKDGSYMPNTSRPLPSSARTNA